MAGESCPQTLGVVVRFGRVIPRTDQHAPDRPGRLALGRGSRATRPFPGHGGHEPRRFGGAAPAPGLAPARAGPPALHRLRLRPPGAAPPSLPGNGGFAAVRRLGHAGARNGWHAGADGGKAMDQAAAITGAETLSPADLWPARQAAWAAQRRHVATASGFYRDLWAGAELPQDLRDLPALPLSDKAQLRADQAAHPPFGRYMAAPPETALRLHRTSGTTGQAMNLALSARDAAITAAVGGRCHRAAGLGPGHRVVHCLDYQMWMGGVTDHMTLEATGALVIPYGVGGTRHLVETIRDLRITAISCTPSYPAVLERVIAEDFPGLAPADLGLRLGLFGGEPGLDAPAFRDRLRAVWGMEPRNANYGVSDVFSNFAAQCAGDTRLHFMAADVLWPELIDAATGAPKRIEAGAEGELVLTHLVRDCQPLVRFRTGDIVGIDATEPCRCGRTGFRFRVIGRADDMVVVRGINVFPSMIAAVLGEVPGLSGDYRILLDGPPPHDVLPVHAETVAAAPPAGLAGQVAAAIKARLGVTARVTLRASGAFPLTEGKTRRVIRGTP
jgi:phenylacetate-CoA ligase